MKKVLLGIIFGLWILSGCTDKIKNVRISGLNEVFIDEEITLTLNKNINKIGWTTSNNDIAVVNEGVVTGVSQGEVTIYIIKNDKILSEHKVIVKSKIPERIEIVNIEDYYEVGKTIYQLTASVYPDYAYQDVISECKDERVNLNSNTGEITFLDDGEIYVVCRSKHDDKIFRTVKLNVKYPDDVEVVNILFIGNSLTYVNDVPGMVSKLARADGLIVKCDSYTVGGNTLGHIVSTRKFYINRY